MKEKIEIYPNKKSLYKLLLGSIVLMMLSGRFLRDSLTTPTVARLYGIVVPTEIVYLLGVLGILLFGFATYYFSQTLIKNKPSIILTKEGLYDSSSSLGIGLIQWHHISDVELYTYYQNTCIGINVIDDELYLQDLSSTQRKLLTTNSSVTGYLISLPVSTLDTDPEELLVTIHSYLHV